MGKAITVLCLVLTSSLSHADLIAGVETFQADLEKKGLTVEASEKFDYVNVTNGGTDQRSTFMGLAEVGLTLDTQKAGLWQGGEFYLHGTNVHSDLKPTGELVGDLQAVNNDEGPRTTRLYEAWYQHHFLDDKFSILAGIHDLNTDFMASEYAGFYINGAFGVPTTLTGNVASSVYPLAAPAVRLKVTPVDNVDVLLGVYDGNPGDPDINEDSITDVEINEKDEGLLTIAEVDYRYTVPFEEGALPGTVKAGAWHHSADVEDVLEVDENGDAVLHDEDYGAYVMVDQLIYQEKEEQGLGVFAMASGAPKNRNEVSHHFAGGANYTGLIPGRDSDVLGIAYTQSVISKKSRESSGNEHDETTIEASYQIKVNDHLAIQPDYQYVMNPSADPAIDNASVVTVRTEISF